MTFECEREQDVLEALAAQRWPRRVEEGLRAHVTACTICTDLIEVVQPLLDEQHLVSQDVRVPPANVVWWRAQIRARHEAALAASRPITIAQAVAVATVLIVAVVLVVGGWARLDLDGWGTALQSLVSGLRGMQVPAPALVGPGRLVLALTLAVGAWLVLVLVCAPLAMYFAVSDDE